jgi:thiol:disulfide interchange protein
MGALSAAIVSPCVAAPLAGALLYIGQTRDAVLGGTALFSMAMGMGVPLVLVGVSGGLLLPKAGTWMSTVKRFFGVLLLGLAVWIITPVIPAAVQMLLWAALLIGSGVFLGALESLGKEASGWERLSKAAGVLALLVGAAEGVGAFSGARDPLRPLAGIFAGSYEAAAPFESITTSADLNARLKTAGRAAMLDFYADWCVSCKEMERFTFSDPKVKARLGQMVLLRVDVTANTPDDKALLKRFRLFGPPGIVFFDANGREIAGLGDRLPASGEIHPIARRRRRCPSLRTRSRRSTRFLEPSRRVEREIRENSVGAGALEREQGFHRALLLGEPAVLERRLQHRVLAAHLVDVGRRLILVFDPPHDVQMGMPGFTITMSAPSCRSRPTSHSASSLLAGSI